MSPRRRPRDPQTGAFITELAHQVQLREARNLFKQIEQRKKDPNDEIWQEEYIRVISLIRRNTTLQDYLQIMRNISGNLTRKERCERAYEALMRIQFRKDGHEPTDIKVTL